MSCFQKSIDCSHTALLFISLFIFCLFPELITCLCSKEGARKKVFHAEKMKAWTVFFMKPWHTHRHKRKKVSCTGKGWWKGATSSHPPSEMSIDRTNVALWRVNLHPWVKKKSVRKPNPEILRRIPVLYPERHSHVFFFFFAVCLSKRAAIQKLKDILQQQWRLGEGRRGMSS